ncbi:MAG: PilZ domain-containing protein [Myxococcota bacterium]
MIKTGSDVLFQEPSCETRRLRRSVVVGVEKDTFSIEFVAEPFAFEPGQEVLMYFNGKREFMQQIGRVTDVETPEADETGPLTFTIEPVGDPISAENRQDYRVSTINSELAARVGSEEELQVQDLSATGFAVLAAEKYELGQTIEVSIAHEDERCHGMASVQSVREFGPGRIRYGMRAIEEDPHTGEFLQTLQRISLAVQREQLQRA